MQLSQHYQKYTVSTERLLLAICVPLAALLLFPLLYLLLRASEVDQQAAFDYLSRMSTLRIIGRSLLLVFSVSLTSCLIGIPAAWLTTRTNLIGREWWSVVLTLPLVIPSYVGAFALIGAFGPRGIFQGWLETLFGIERLPPIYGFWGAWFSVTLFSYPYIFLNVRAGLRGIDPALEEASRTLGKTAWETFYRVTLPQLRPFISAGILLVALYTLSDFGAVAMMQYNVFTRAIYLQLGVNLNFAALLSLVLVIFTIAIMAVSILMEGRGQYYTQNIHRKPRLVKLGRWQLAAQLYCFLILGVALIGPMSVVAYWLYNGYIVQGEPLTDIIRPLQSSMRIAALAALACGVTAVPLVFLQVRYPKFYNQWIARSAYLGYALPGVVVALALVFVGARYFSATLYQTLPMLIFAYVIRFLPQALGPARASLMQVSPTVEECGLTLGKSRRKVFWGITLPLMRPGLVTGMALVFLTTMKELPLTLLLAPIGYDTLAVRIWSATGELFYARAAAPALVMVIISALSLVFVLDSDERR